MKRPTIAVLAALALTTASMQSHADTIIKSFGILTNVTGRNPIGQLVRGPDGTLFGTCSSGEGAVAGTVFKVRPDGSGFMVLKWFTNTLEGANPQAGLVLGGSTLYGTTSGGGTNGYGTVFKLNTNATGFAVLKHFLCSDGVNPRARLVLDGSTLYGATSDGGTYGMGTVFRMNTDGSDYNVLKHFSYWYGGGVNPSAGLVLSGSALYGTTSGLSSSQPGTIFKLNTNGTGFSVLKAFSATSSWPATNSDGAYPSADLILSGSTLYGTASGGGANACGTVFSLNTGDSTYRVLKTFSAPSGYPSTNSDGANPRAALVLDGSTLYGTTSGGGTNGGGTVFSLNTDSRAYTVLKHFAGYPNEGANPQAGLVLDGSTLYGTTSGGGSSGAGTVFTVSTDGSSYAALKDLTNSSEDAFLNEELVLSGGALYGTMSGGGTEWLWHGL